jgi:RIO-like serine/threonine protein kinase
MYYKTVKRQKKAMRQAVCLSAPKPVEESRHAVRQEAGGQQLLYNSKLEKSDKKSTTEDIRDGGR